ncbi:PREDICTED: uncharacterized protein LOC109184574 [Ipomoea nil]|uniref:uncharacterized protein LOC109184574 n=1 Tax=Ipomoea nil TaxID=35883 RepID=UPI000900E597|nr:PREDICTED: uncharacterized protein LOC109184574 [Ipomoea nil]
MNMLSWNVRGLLSSRTRLKRLLRRERIRFALIIEPMLTSDRLSSLNQELGFSNGYASLETKIWLFWSTDFELDIMADTDQFVCSRVLYKPWQFSFIYVAVYGKYSRAERTSLWQQLSSLLESSAPFILGGDFNVISSISEYRGDALPDKNNIGDFSSFIHDNNLLDLPVTGSLYTWHGRRTTGAVWKRLDRFLLNSHCRDSFTEVQIQVLARTTSDHAPLVFTATNNSMSCPKQFRFQRMWLSHPDFKLVVRQNWSLPADGGGMRALAYKLKRLKIALKVWNKEIFGNVFDRVKVLEAGVAAAKHTYASNPSEESRASLHALQADLLMALKQEECFWRQKARIKWLREGDANTRYFHAVVKDRHRRQRISSVKNSGLLLTTQEDIQQEAVNFYTTLFSAEDCPGSSALVDCLSSGLTDREAQSLLAPLSREEVKEAVWKLDPDSAAGPDGFSGVFYRDCWDLVHEDVFWAVQDFFVGVPIPRAMASAQIVLIPKKSNPDSFADYRPYLPVHFHQ